MSRQCKLEVIMTSTGPCTCLFWTCCTAGKSILVGGFSLVTSLTDHWCKCIVCLRDLMCGVHRDSFTMVIEENSQNRLGRTFGMFAFAQRKGDIPSNRGANRNCTGERTCAPSHTHTHQSICTNKGITQAMRSFTCTQRFGS